MQILSFCGFLSMRVLVDVSLYVRGFVRACMDAWECP